MNTTVMATKLNGKKMQITVMVIKLFFHYFDEFHYFPLVLKHAYSMYYMGYDKIKNHLPKSLTVKFIFLF